MLSTMQILVVRSGHARPLLLLSSIAAASACSKGSPPAEDDGAASEFASAMGSGGGDPASGGLHGAGSSLSAGGSGTGGAGLSAGGEVGATGGTVAGSGGGALPDITFEYDPSLDRPPETCAELTVTAAPLPLDVYVILSRSGSMWNGNPQPPGIAEADCDVDLDGPPSSTSKWCYAVNALGRYFASEASRGHRAALQFMIPEVNLASDSACLHGAANPHSQPAVELTPLPVLPTEAGGLIQALNEMAAGSGQIEPESAFNGIVDYTSANRTLNRKLIALLVNDGVIAGICNEDVEFLAAIPRNHYDATGIPTFIMGMTDAYFDVLEAFADGAGSPAQSDFCDPSVPAPCHYWSVGDGEPEAFAAALSSIEETVVGCAYSLPDSDVGLVDPDSARVELKTDPTAPEEELVQVSNLASCVDAGFYVAVEGEGFPLLRLCPSTCATVTEQSEVKVHFTCEGQ
jgi:hypothetical protein